MGTILGTARIREYYKGRLEKSKNCMRSDIRWNISSIIPSGSVWNYRIISIYHWPISMSWISLLKLIWLRLVVTFQILISSTSTLCCLLSLPCLHFLLRLHITNISAWPQLTFQLATNIFDRRQILRGRSKEACGHDKGRLNQYENYMQSDIKSNILPAIPAKDGTIWDYRIISICHWAANVRMAFLQLIDYVKLSHRRFYFPVISFYDEIVSVVDGFHTGFW